MTVGKTKNTPVDSSPAPSSLSPLFCFWILGWLLGGLTIAGVGISLYFDNKDEIILDDWRGEGSDSSYWPDQYFEGYTADRLRRITTYRGKNNEVLAIRFFASIPMDYRRFDLELQRWRTLPEFQGVGNNSYPPLRSKYCPDWFPTRNYVGSLAKPWKTYHLFRIPGDDHLYVE